MHIVEHFGNDNHSWIKYLEVGVGKQIFVVYHATRKINMLVMILIEMKMV